MSHRVTTDVSPRHDRCFTATRLMTKPQQVDGLPSVWWAVDPFTFNDDLNKTNLEKRHKPIVTEVTAVKEHSFFIFLP